MTTPQSLNNIALTQMSKELEQAYMLNPEKLTELFRNFREMEKELSGAAGKGLPRTAAQHLYYTFVSVNDENLELKKKLVSYEAMRHTEQATNQTTDKGNTEDCEAKEETYMGIPLVEIPEVTSEQLIAELAEENQVLRNKVELSKVQEISVQKYKDIAQQAITALQMVAHSERQCHLLDDLQRQMRK